MKVLQDILVIAEKRVKLVLKDQRAELALKEYLARMEEMVQLVLEVQLGLKDARENKEYEV